MSLTDWRRNTWLTEHQPTAHEIGGLLAVADRDLKDSAVAGLSADSQLALAYNAQTSPQAVVIFGFG